MNKIFSISALAAGMLTLASCNDVEPKTPQEDDNDPNAINFSIGQGEASSRTQYSAEDDLQIEWIKGDYVTISATPAQGTTTSAKYVVSRAIQSTKNIDGKEVTTNSKAKIAPTGTALKWSGDVQHTFHGIYGEEASITDVQDGSAKATLKYSTTQTLNKVNGSWVNMQQAYMVALAKYDKPAESVNLNFHPIMTTLDVEIKGMDEGAEGAKAINVESMSVTIDANSDVLYYKDWNSEDTYFDIEFNSSDGSSISSVTTDPSQKGEKVTRAITFEFAEAQKVDKGESIKITAILPNISINSSAPITITVTTDDGINSFTFSNEVPSGNKAKIITQPWVTTEAKYVDLGLPSGTLWATCNLGASTPKEYGDYYGWGSREAYTIRGTVSWSTYFQKLGGTGTSYVDCGTSKDPLMEYVNPNSKSIAGTKWDAAHVKLGGNWRMPTKGEWQELIDNCTFTWDSANKRLVATSTKNSNYIYLPAGGQRDGTSTSAAGINGFYWSSIPPVSDTGYYDFAKMFCFYSSSMNCSADVNVVRCFGLLIRPVMK